MCMLVNKNMAISVDCAAETGPLRHIWRSTGFTPAAHLLRDDMRQMLSYVSAVPHGGVRHARIHYLLELVSASGLDSETPTYDWSRLDRAVDLLQANGIAPFFELMGTLSGLFTDFEDERQLRAWRRVVADLASHLIARYGEEEVKSWYFECWNEPDLGSGFSPPLTKNDCLALTRYYDACAAGLSDAHPGLTLGGPGTGIHLSDPLKRFLQHCETGTNYCTGQTGTRLDFISHHWKGGWGSPELLSPNTDRMIQHSRELAEYIRDCHGGLAGIPIMNDEADPMVPWLRPLIWRGRPYYAAITTRVIGRYLNEVDGHAGCRVDLVGNDHGFLGGWGHRTLLARFTPEGMTPEPDERTVAAEPPSKRTVSKHPKAGLTNAFALVKKPILNTMALWAMQGDVRLAVDGLDPSCTELDAICSRRGSAQVAVLLYHNRDEVMSGGFCAEVSLRLANLPFEQCSIVRYEISERLPHPMQVWVELGHPTTPSDDQLARMRAVQELTAVDGPRELDCTDGVELTFDLPLHSVSLVLLSKRPDQPPQVGRLRGERYEGLNELEEVLLSWDCASRVIRTFEMLKADSPGGPFARVNEQDVVSNCFLHARPRGARLAYKVRAVDFWGAAAESEVVDL